MTTNPNNYYSKQSIACFKDLYLYIVIKINEDGTINAKFVIELLNKPISEFNNINPAHVMYNNMVNDIQKNASTN